MAGTFDDRAAYVEFTEQPSVVKAFGLMGATLGDRQIMVQHSNCAIIKPSNIVPSAEDVLKADSGVPVSTEKRRSRSRSKGRSDRSRRSRSRKRKTSQSRSRRGSRSRRRSKSGRRRSRSHSKKRRSRSKSDRRRGGRLRSRSRGHKKPRRSRSPSERRRRSRSRDRAHERRDRDAGKRDRSKDREKERTRRDKSRDKGRNRSREGNRGHDKEREFDNSKNRGRDRSRDKNKEKDKSKASSGIKSSRRHRSRSVSKERSSRKRLDVKADQLVENSVKSPISSNTKDDVKPATDMKAIDNRDSVAANGQDSDVASIGTSSHENGTEIDVPGRSSESDKPAVVGVKLAGPEDMDVEVPIVDDVFKDSLEGSTNLTVMNA